MRQLPGPLGSVEQEIGLEIFGRPQHGYSNTDKQVTDYFPTVCCVRPGEGGGRS